jgi:hypothetical protein
MRCFAPFTPFARKLLALWMSLFALSLAGCAPASPDSVVQNFWKAVADNRVDEAVGYFSLKDVKENDLTSAKGKVQMIVGQLHSDIQKKGGLESVLTTVGEQTDTTAKVKAEVKFKNGTSKSENFNLVKDSDGSWRIKLTGLGIL